jgi:hypothetical protein
MSRLAIAGCVLGLAACGSSRSGAPLPSQHDLGVGRAISAAEHAWDVTYARWNRAYLAGRRGPFLAAARETEPALDRAASAMYSAAIATEDPALRRFNLDLGQAYLHEASGIHLVDYAVLHELGQGEVARGIHELDSARRSTLSIAEQFIAFFQRRYGYNPLAKP